MPSAQGRDIVQEVFEWKRKVEEEKRRITSVCQPRGAERPSIASGLAPAATRLRAGSSDQYDPFASESGSEPHRKPESALAARRDFGTQHVGVGDTEMVAPGLMSLDSLVRVSALDLQRLEPLSQPDGLVLPLRGERQVSQSCVLVREGPGGLTVPRQVHARKRVAHGQVH